MKNNLKLLALVMTATMLSGCFSPKGGSGNTDSSSFPGEKVTWSEEIQAEMQTYLGELLPFVQLDDNTLTSLYSDELGGYFMYDDSETSAFTSVDYGQELIKAGYTKTQDDYGDDVYLKDYASGYHGQLYFGWDEATDSVPAGNFISVYLNAIVDEDVLIEMGYEKQTGWPTELVASTMDGSGKTLAGVNTTGVWYVASDVYQDTDEDYYYFCAYLATAGSYGEAFAANCESAGLTFDDEFACYYDADFSSDEEIYIYEQDGFTFIDIYGPSFDGTAPISGSGDVGGDETNPDGSITVEFTFGGNLADQTSLNGTGFSTDNASIIFNKGDSNTAPTYYTNGNTVRCYATNNIVITCLAESYAIMSVEMTIGSSNSKKWDNAADLYTLSSGTATATETKTTISGVNQTTLTIGIGMNKSGGNIAFSKITVNLGPIY